MPPPFWHEAKAHLSQSDARLGALIATYTKEWMVNLYNPFHTLARAIVGQQISTKAADSIWARLENLLQTLEPEVLLQQTSEDLRGCGLSQSKVNYLRNIANAFVENQLTPEQWHAMDDAAILQQLTTIKGIGVWTAEMFLIFHLHRPDVLPLGDIGLVKGIHKLVGAQDKLSKAELIAIAEPWRPYRSVATWYLWRSLDPVAVQY
jgi:DNA-3-methyladenine glycosylase II